MLISLQTGLRILKWTWTFELRNEFTNFATNLQTSQRIYKLRNEFTNFATNLQTSQRSSECYSEKSAKIDCNSCLLGNNHPDYTVHKEHSLFKRRIIEGLLIARVQPMMICGGTRGNAIPLLFSLRERRTLNVNHKFTTFEIYYDVDVDLMATWPFVCSSVVRYGAIYLYYTTICAPPTCRLAAVQCWLLD